MLENEEKLFPVQQYLAGIDEAGRGPLAGPLVVAAVILKRNLQISGLNDSKKLTESHRNELYHLIIAGALDYSLEIVPPSVIDDLNILQATLQGMKQAAANLRQIPDLCLIDGDRIPADMPCNCQCFIKGDARFASIAAASILAKVTRDRIMLQYHQEYPVYGFDKNKGYPTPEHLDAIKKHGICVIHRKSYAPVRQMILPFA